MKVKMGIGFLEGDKRPPREAFQTWWEPPGKADRETTAGEGSHVATGMQLRGAVRSQAQSRQSMQTQQQAPIK